jgi:DNA invertase Pin-like site-specific DNA recombinase
MEKIKAIHLSRLAIVYLRQSTLAQVEHNLESTKLQYSQDKRAEALGWEPDQIRVIDIDLGKSGKSIENRPGFNELMNLVANKKVGIVLVNELSRLSRDSEHWARFVKFCQKTNTLIADYESVYDPNNPSDALALGIRGTLNSLESFTNRVRLQETKRNKARDGKLEITLPTGLIWKNKEIVFDPDKDVQSCIQLLFDLLEKYGAAWRVLQHCLKNNILIPTRHSKIRNLLLL